MCGIAGIIELGGEKIDPGILKSMTDVIRHRGPDDEGYVLINQATSRFRSYSGHDSPSSIQELHSRFQPSEIDFDGNIGLSHRRFSIIDLTAAGHQPFFDHDHSCCIVFNGEIYNYIELRVELEKEGIQFRTHSDTEVLLESYKAWGVECFKKFNGFWALALYDFRKKCLLLSRDRIGKRPLYWFKNASRVYFASEIKSLLKVPEIARNKRVNQDAIWYWCSSGMRDLNFSTCFENIFSLPSASWVIVDENFPSNCKTFWEVPKIRMSENDIGISEAATLIRKTLMEAIRIRLRADVPIAIELSGGLDSSTVLALTAQTHPERITTYTVRFHDPGTNEEPFARAVAKHYNVDYRVIDPPIQTFWQHILAFTYLQEEPYHSPNLQTSQDIWSHMRTQGTKVVLSGASGDEMFAGYTHYYSKAQKENLRTGYYLQFIENALRWTERRYNFKKLALALIRSPIAYFFKNVVSQSSKLRRRNRHCLSKISMPLQQYNKDTLTELLYSDITNTLIPYWLRSGDKTLMGVPFEGRCPFLDYRVIELATQLPVTYLIRDGWHKWILRKAMEDYLPADVVWRKQKMGFPFPLRTFFEKYEKIIDLILSQMNNPYIEFSDKARLRNDWRAISFILWYELFFNENFALFEKIENMANQSQTITENNGKYSPEFLSSCEITSI
ncbi:MAG: asparagine synthase (glutamine-hydrolyzing) [Planctomycetia bacterium]|nr:asparagine synthase (glutamine-hydrolyzing) [Candidatus Brocadia sp.]QOJ06489.1 MAG: asparagine synthase (glutamine-hydrolyzing) [Planctomycetia bacterium]TVL95258.1 MAG: asparagine synthase (glutamine-hydrolyzing) [Candidatus Brocadia sp. BL1]HQU31711.1 asparagine synthase (glutamine-hydrolyzing) [Candidatus Brocadia sapporoensis]